MTPDASKAYGQLRQQIGSAVWLLHLLQRIEDEWLSRAASQCTNRETENG
jgi:hypothetical protein